jgi:predicted ATPase
MFHQFLQEAQAVEQQANALIALANEQGIAVPLAGAVVQRGWARAEQGQVEEGIREIHQSMAVAQATGMALYRPYHLGLLAEAYRQAKQVQEGLSALNEALTLADKTGECYYEAELYRLKGELTLAQSEASLKRVTDKSQTSQDQSEDSKSQSLNPKVQEEAEACFRQAIAIAQKQQARSWELRATVSLARLWQQQGKSAEAHGMLSDIYHWFTEGFDTKDLQEAKALLEELA